MIKPFAATLLAISLVLLGWAMAPDLNAQTMNSSNCLETFTTFRDISFFGRKNGAAKNMNKDHAKYAEDNWSFSDMEPYVENADLEGFFITYTRPIACKIR